MKRQLITLVLVGIYAQLIAQVNIRGHFTNSQNWSDKVYLLAIKNQSDIFTSTNRLKTDTAVMTQEGNFNFRIDKLPCEDCLYRLEIRPKEATGPFIYVGTSKENYALFELKNGLDIDIKANADQLTKSFKIEQQGSLWSYEKLRKIREPLYVLADSIAELFTNPQYIAGKNIDSLKGQLMQQLMNAYDLENKTLIKYIMNYNNIYDQIVGLHNYDYDNDIQNDIATYETVLNKIDDKNKEHPYFKQLQKSVYEAKFILPIGSQAPQFVIPDSINNPISLNSIGKNLILVDFWASWCGPCRIENKSTVRPLYEQYKAKGFTVVSISLDDNRDKWLKAVVNDRMTWINLSDLKGDKSQLYKDYKIEALPTTYLIDKEGYKIIAKNVRGENLVKFVKDYYEKK